MTTSVKVLIMLGLWGLYSLIVWFGCLSGCCGAGQSDTALTDNKANTAAVPAAIENESRRYPIDFQWATATPNTNEGFDAMKESLLTQMGNDNILDITGYYFDGEAAPTGFDNMGFARASEIKTLLGIDLPDDRIRYHARLMDGTKETKTGYFEGFEYKWVDAEKTVAETVEELDDRIIIRFPFGSIEKEYSPEVDNYLDKLVERVQQTNEKISLTGHTDHIGEDQTNIKLGQARSDQIKKILIEHGVDANLISTTSRGESQPVSSNETEEGRHENRRVEVRLIKN